MSFTSLHRYLGEPPTPLTAAMLDEAVARGIPESGDLDWKSALPARSALVQSDFPKDVAAMANSGGGTLIYGVKEVEKRAAERTDAGEIDEKYERSIHAVAYTAISPPVLGLRVETIVADGLRAYAVIVPDSPDAPHLIYKNQFFGAPVRTDSDTAWMRERDVEAAYRARFTGASTAESTLDQLYQECVRAQGPERSAQFIAVARPRHPQMKSARPRSVVTNAVYAAYALSSAWYQSDLRRMLGETLVRVLDNLDPHRPRKGYRRWTAVSERIDASALTAHAAIHDDGTVTLGQTGGGQRLPHQLDPLPPGQITSRDLEVFIGDFLALLTSATDDGHGGEMDLLIGIEWSGREGIKCWETDSRRSAQSAVGTFSGSFVAVRTSISTLASDDDYYQAVRSVALDCLSQFGITQLGTLADIVTTPVER